MSSIHSHSLTAHSAYIDLRNMLLDDQVSELKGSVERKQVGSRVYLYDRYRLGDRVVSRYIGEGTPELEERIARAEAIRVQAAEREKAKGRLARLLRAEGLQGFDVATGSLLAALARVGVFRLGGTVVGTIAFRLYEGELGVRGASEALRQTGDLDIASFERLSLALGDKVTEPLGEVLKELRFEPVPSLMHHRILRWRDTTREANLEFLTPAFGEEGVRDLPALGVGAQALRYLNYLIAEPIKAVALYRSGVLVQVPRPESYAIHKLIVADRRKGGPDALKAGKDRAQAAFLVEALAEERPDDLRDAWEDARSRGPRWRERMDRTLARMPETAGRLAAL